VDTGGAMLHRTVIAYPESARAKRVQGVVTVEATLDGRGNVVDTRVLNGPLELRRAAQQSVLNWHFAMDSAVNTRMVKVSFELPAESATPPASHLNDSPEVARRDASSLEGKRVGEIYIGGVTDQVRSDLMSRLPVHAGDTLAAGSMDRLRAVVHEFDEHLNLGFGVISNGEVNVTIQMFGGGSADAISGRMPLAGVPGGVVGGVPGGIRGGVPGGVLGGVPSVTPPADMPRRITVGGNVQQANLISQPKPVYPPEAKQAHISGVVHLQAVIGKEGNIINLTVISGHPLLIPSAMEAVRQWVYRTTLLNGEPVEVVTQIDVNYTLADDPPVEQ
jgi:TonB family protein